MPTYEFRCRNCGATYETRTHSDSVPCGACGNDARRDYSSVQLGRSAFTPHYNYAVGKFVSTDREFREALKVGAAEAKSDFTPIYPGDVRDGMKGDTSGWETHLKRDRDNGLTEAKTKVIL